MNWLVEIPIVWRLVALAVMGFAAGALINAGVYGLAWNVRAHSPWSRKHPKPLRPGDRIPIVGWFLLRRHSDAFGRGFWLRPLLIEALTAAIFVTLYWWEIYIGGVVPPLHIIPTSNAPWGAGLVLQLHMQFVAHVVLASLMLVATFIDVDEQTIPDEVTIPGTLLGLLLAAMFPWCLPAQGVLNWPQEQRLDFLNFTSFPTQEFPSAVSGFPHGWGLAVGLGCYLLWCFALLPRPWYTNHGIKRALGLMFARIAREDASKMVLALAVVGTLGVTAIWFVGGVRWIGLLTALVGLLASGGIVWMVRVLGGWALKQEAMGFGDVTLMAMIGAFLGWQACLVIFFIAPFAGLLVGIVQLVVHREKFIPYGPFLCLGAAVVVVMWAKIWLALHQIFELSSLIPVVIFGCLLLMAVMLRLWRAAKEAVFGGYANEED